MSKTEILMMRQGLALKPYDDLAEDQLVMITTKKPVLVTVNQTRNPLHHAKLWALAAAVANFDKDFSEAEDAVEWVKLHIPNMYEEYRLKDGRLAIKTRSIAWASMDQTSFGRFYDRALWLWSEKIGCDPESLLTQVKEANR